MVVRVTTCTIVMMVVVVVGGLGCADFMFPAGQGAAEFAQQAGQVTVAIDGGLNAQQEGVGKVRCAAKWIGAQ